MYLYNISIIVEESVHLTVSSWLRDEILTEKEYDLKFLSMIDSPHEGFTYCLQLHSPDESTIERFKSLHLSKIQEYLSQNHPNQAFIFDSLMKYIYQD